MISNLRDIKHASHFYTIYIIVILNCFCVYFHAALSLLMVNSEVLIQHLKHTFNKKRHELLKEKAFMSVLKFAHFSEAVLMM